MALKMVVDTIEGMDEGIAKLYVEKDGKFSLDVDGHVNPDTGDRIPKSRLDAEIEKRKAADATLKEVADSYVDESIPEDMRDMVPDLPPAQKIKWIQQANAKGLFDAKSREAIDTRKPGDKKPAALDGMSPHAMMSMGYSKK
jgi:hypothetical protein